MKILFVTSFYSAIRKSILMNDWQPSGMPAIAKLFEGLHKRNIPFDNVFITKAEARNAYHILSNVRFQNTSHILSQKRTLNTPFLRNLGRSIDEIRLYLKIRKIYSSGQYDLVYVDRENIVAAALLARQGASVITRLHGVSNYYEQFRKYYYRLMNLQSYLSLKAPFKHIICSKDGSPGEQMIAHFFRKNIPSSTLLNGVNFYSKQEDEQADSMRRSFASEKPIILFVGRFSEDKGIREFVESLKTLKTMTSNFTCLIIGDGILFESLSEDIYNLKSDSIKLLGSLPHNEVRSYFKICDIYVSLNKLGNLSNTVLEAIASSSCIVTLKKDLDSEKDTSTQNFFNEAALYVSRENISGELPKVLHKLVEDKSALDTQKSKIALCKSKLQSWDERIFEEIELMKGICNNHV